MLFSCSNKQEKLIENPSRWINFCESSLQMSKLNPAWIWNGIGMLNVSEQTIKLNELHSVSPVFCIMNYFQFVFVSRPFRLLFIHNTFLWPRAKQNRVTNLIIPISDALGIDSNWKFFFNFSADKFFTENVFVFFPVIHRGNWRFQF